MNLYQHLLILIPAFTLAYWGFYAKESTGTIVAALTGAIVAYLVYVIIVPLIVWLSAL